MFYFVITLGITLLITLWAARQSHGRAGMYSASSRLTSTQNGLAIAGDFMSANTFLGTVALYFLSGADAFIYFCTPLVGFWLMWKFLAGPLRRLGRFTLGDVLQNRFPQRRVRLLLGGSTIGISLIYLVAQLVGAGALMSVLFEISFNHAVILVGALMTTYVVFGGMLAASWVQIVKAVFLVGATITLGVLAIARADGLRSLYAQAAARSGMDVFSFGGMGLDTFSALSLTLGLTAGMLGLPHLLIRLFTVPDENTARRSLLVAAAIVFVSFAVLLAVISPASLVFVKNTPAFYDGSGAIRGGANMVTVHLAAALGGDALFGAVSAVAFATILAVVAGLTVAIAGACSHDVYASIRGALEFDEQHEVLRFRLAALLAACCAVSLAIVFQHENLAFLVSMAFSVAASTTFPLLILTLYWPGLTAAGAMAGGVTGLVLSTGLIILGPACWVKTFGFAAPVFSSDYPALISVPAAFFTMWLVSRA